MRAPEDELFARFRESGRPELLGRVYDQVAPELLHVALHLLGRPAEAEDALQATFLVAIEKAGDWDAARPLKPWLLGILARQAQQARARAGRRPDPERLASRASEPVGADLEREELAQALDRALFALPEATRSALVLRLRHGLDPIEIAHALGRPPGTVRAQLSRGLERLRRLLPASLAGGSLSALELAPRGLDAVRAAVVTHARAQLSWPAALLGGLAVKKLVLAAALVAAVLCVPLARAWLRAPRPARPSAAPAATAALAVPERPAALPAPEPSAAGEERVALALPQPDAPEPAPAETGALRVRVRDARGAPAAGEWVAVDVLAQERAFPFSAWARSDASGEALLADLPPGFATVALLRGRQDGVAIEAGRTAQLTLALVSGIDVRGEVVDDAGRPVAGAEIWVARRWSFAEGAVLARADAAGRFGVAGLSRDHALGARAPGWASSLLVNPQGDPGATVEVRLVLDERAATLEGVVQDPEGRPLERAEVLCGAETPDETRRLADGTVAFGPPPARAVTGADGRFRLEHVRGGPLPVRVRRAGHAPFAGVLDARDGPCAIVLDPAVATLEGRVLDARGAPVRGATVLTAPESFLTLRTWTDGAGSFRLAGLPAGAVTVAAWHPELGRDERAFAVAPGARLAWEARLARQLAFEGRLEDARGAPLEGWTVVAWRGREIVRGSAPSDAAGAFRVEVEEDGAYTLRVQDRGGWRAFPALTRRGVRPGEGPLVLRLEEEPLGRVLLRVVTEGGAPARAQVSVWHEEEALYREFEVDPLDGHVAIEHVVPGTLELSLQSEEHPWRWLDPVRVGPGETVDLGALVLAPGGVLEGELSGLPDELARGVRLLVADERGREAAAVELVGRRFRSSALADGRYLLSAQGDGVRSRSVPFELAAGSTPYLALGLERAAVRALRLRVPGGVAKVPAGVGCQLFDAQGGLAWSGGAPVLDGAVALVVSAPPGRYRLVAQGGALGLEAPFELLGGQDEPPLELVLERR